MKTRTKALLLALSAVLLVVSTVFATLAFLTSKTEVVKNTFTVGNVIITLDEADVDNSTADKDRDTANEYHLLPGKKYEKDPTVHVDSSSEDCYIFVKVVNNIAAIEAATETDDYTNIAGQIAANDWVQLKDANGNDVEGVYYYKYKVAKTDAKRDYVVFSNFKISGTVDNTTLAGYVTKTNADSYIQIQAYAIQADGFANAAAAWAAAPTTWGN